MKMFSHVHRTFIRFDIIGAIAKLRIILSSVANFLKVSAKIEKIAKCRREKSGRKKLIILICQKRDRRSPIRKEGIVIVCHFLSRRSFRNHQRFLFSLFARGRGSLSLSLSLSRDFNRARRFPRRNRDDEFAFINRNVSTQQTVISLLNRRYPDSLILTKTFDAIAKVVRSSRLLLHRALRNHAALLPGATR